MPAELKNIKSSDNEKNTDTDADSLLSKDNDGVDQNKPTSGLKRQVNLLGGICLLVGTIIGSGTNGYVITTLRLFRTCLISKICNLQPLSRCIFLVNAMSLFIVSYDRLFINYRHIIWA